MAGTGSEALLQLSDPGVAGTVADMRPGDSARLIAQYLRYRLREVDGVTRVICAEADRGYTITVVVEDLRGPARRQVHDAFYAIRSALQPSHVDLTVAQRDTL